jgi:SAM-dependent methyltransferase
MNWAYLRFAPWLDTRARFVAGVPAGGTLVDLGSSDGVSLGHMAELRPDLRLGAVDRQGEPAKYPPRCRFQRVDLETGKLEWADGSVDAVTCLHLVEHLKDPSPMLREIARILKPSGRAFFETPHPKTVTLSSAEGAAAGTFPMNFYDDMTHVRVVAVGVLAQLARNAGLEVTDTGISRNWLFAAAYPALWFGPPGKWKFTSKLHWLGWSAYLIARRPR